MSATLDESRVLSIALAAILALNGYLAIRNFAYTFFGPLALEGRADAAGNGRRESTRAKKESWRARLFHPAHLASVHPVRRLR